MATPLTISVLTPLQCEILKRFAEGATTLDIADERKCSPKTIEYHRAAIMKTLQLHSIAQLTHWAIGMGLLAVMFQNETPEITLDLVAKMHQARMAANRARFLENIKKDKIIKPKVEKPKLVINPKVEPVPLPVEPTPEVEPVPLPVEPAPVVEPVPMPTGEPEYVPQLSFIKPNEPEVKREPIVKFVPAQEQKPVETPVVVPDVPAQEQKLRVFKPKVKKVVIPKPKEHAPEVKEIYDLGPVSTLTTRPQPKRKSPPERVTAWKTEAYQPEPYCEKCGGRHGPQWVCRGPMMIPETPKHVSSSTFKLTPLALRLLAKQK